MFTEAELLDALNELEGGRHTIQNCEKMAAIYTVLDHTRPIERGYSQEARAESVGLYGKSQFLRAIAGKPTEDVQTAELRANNATVANQLLAEMRQCPIPAQPVYGSQPIFTCGGGCNCGNL